jgi:hypothetical protein
MDEDMEDGGGHCTMTPMTYEEAESCIEDLFYQLEVAFDRDQFDETPALLAEARRLVEAYIPPKCRKVEATAR